MVLRIHHVQIAMPVGGEDTALGFYAGILGLREIPNPRISSGSVASGSGVRTVPSNSTWGSKRRSARRGRRIRLWSVDDLELVREALESAGFPIVVETQLEGYRRFYTTDPFGNRVEILAEDPGTSGA